MPKTCISMPLQSLGTETFSKTCTLICSQMLFHLIADEQVETANEI